MKLKKGDNVIVITGKDKGKKGEIVRVLREKDRVVVSGVAMIKRHMKPKGKEKTGSIVEVESSIHASNVKLAEKKVAAKKAK
jgi:large subunit ribosomal protein L24